eukprot:SAG31_NODE_15476_length_753_cov_1.061162_1_plen_145_part_00
MNESQDRVLVLPPAESRQGASCWMMNNTDLSCFWPLSNRTLSGICSVNASAPLCTTYCTELMQLPAPSAASCCNLCINSSSGVDNRCTAFAWNRKQQLCYMVGAGSMQVHGHLVNCSKAGGSHCSSDTSGFIMLKLDDADRAIN